MMNAVAFPPALAALPVMLVVDDEDGPRKSIRIVFQDQFRVLMATNGQEALAIARAQPVDIAICDIRMAGCSGIDVLRSFKEIDPHTEVIMLTAYETLDTARQALRLGACDYLSKPFDLSTIREAAARALHLRRISGNLANASERLKKLNGRLNDVALREEVARTTNEIYAGVLHDINNPLTAISGYVEMLDHRIKAVSVLRGDDLDKVRGDLNYIRKQVDTCTTIASRYRRFVHQREFPEARLPVNHVLKDLQTLLRTHPATEGRHLVVQTLPVDATPFVDSTDLLQILLNLATNALQSSQGEQTVRITVTRQEDPLPIPFEIPSETEIVLGEASFPNQPPLLAITISDEGDGISPENLARIFEPYFTTKVLGGTGLGLSIVSRLVLSSHGLVHLKTEVGRGTEATVYFRLTD